MGGEAELGGAGCEVCGAGEGEEWGGVVGAGAAPGGGEGEGGGEDEEEGSVSGDGRCVGVFDAGVGGVGPDVVERGDGGEIEVGGEGEGEGSGGVGPVD